MRPASPTIHVELERKIARIVAYWLRVRRDEVRNGQALTGTPNGIAQEILAALASDSPQPERYTREEVVERLKPVVEKLERIRDLDEQMSDGALGALARYALDHIATLFVAFPGSPEQGGDGDWPEEAVEVAARAAYENVRELHMPPFDEVELTPNGADPRQGFRDRAAPHVQAAAPFIAAEAVTEVTKAHTEAVRRAGKAERERDQAQKALEGAEDRFEFCDNCERPAREDDLKVVWCKDAESGEQVDARICLVCRLEAKLDDVTKGRDQARKQVLEEVREALEAEKTRCEEKRDREGTAGNADGEAYWQGKGHGLAKALELLPAIHPDQSKKDQ